VFTRARRAVFSISAKEACVERRGFSCANPDAAARLERIGTEFIGGYHAALEEPSAGPLATRLNSSAESEYRGFSFEGAAMGLTLLDSLSLASGSFERFARGPGNPHIYMLHVGAGWALARLPWLRRGLDRAIGRFDPLLRWLAVDGYGFHEGYFHWRQSVRRQSAPRGVRGYAQRAFDHGLGRSLWFVEGIDPQRIGATIGRFAEGRRSDLWAGVGLACAYAGGAPNDGVKRLAELSADHAPQLAQGAAFAAEARRRAGNMAAHTDAACRVLCGTSAEEAAAVARQEMQALPPDGAIPAYEVWRARIQRRFQAMAQPVAESRSLA
jgi:enediyne biosynthesis protein E3